MLIQSLDLEINDILKTDALRQLGKAACCLISKKQEHNELENIHSSSIYKAWKRQSWALTLSTASGSGAGTTLEEKERLLMVDGEIGTDLLTLCMRKASCKYLLADSLKRFNFAPLIFYSTALLELQTISKSHERWGFVIQAVSFIFLLLTLKPLKTHRCAQTANSAFLSILYLLVFSNILNSFTFLYFNLR